MSVVSEIREEMGFQGVPEGPDRGERSAQGGRKTMPEGGGCTLERPDAKTFLFGAVMVTRYGEARL